jgi:flavodoxin
MNSLVIYYSKFGNTRSIAEAIAETLGAAGPARALSIDQVHTADFDEVDLVVMGSPTHYQNLPKVVRPVLKALPRKILAGKSVAAFDTSLKMWGPIMLLTAAHRLLPRLRRLGGKRVVRPETFLVEGNGPLCDGELERAREWAAAML